MARATAGQSGPAPRPPRPPRPIVHELGHASYLAHYPHWLAETAPLFAELSAESALCQESIRLFGRLVAQPRLTTWYGIEMEIATKYKTVRAIHAFPPRLETLRAALSGIAKTEFNSVLVNYYRNGLDSVAWHADDEPALGRDPVIASLSLGATRRFVLKERPTAGSTPSRDSKTERRFQRTEILLQDGDLAIMGGSLQHHFVHAVPKQPKLSDPRINLTFRCYHLGATQ